MPPAKKVVVKKAAPAAAAKPAPVVKKAPPPPPVEEVEEIIEEDMEQDEPVVDEKDSQKVYHTFAMVKGEVRRAKHAKPLEFFYCVLPDAFKNSLRNMYADDIPKEWSEVFCHEFAWNKHLPRPTNGNVIEVKIRRGRKPNKKGEYSPEVTQVFSIHRNPFEICDAHGKKVPKNWTELLQKNPAPMMDAGMGGGMGMMPMMGDFMGMPGMNMSPNNRYMMSAKRLQGGRGGMGRGRGGGGRGGKSPRGGKAPASKAAEKEKVAATGIYKSFD